MIASPRASADGGRTWAPAVKLPVPAGQICSHPVVAYAPGGSRAYAAYARSLPGSCFSEDCSNDILFSTSENGGKTWSAPTIAFMGLVTIRSYVPPHSPPRPKRPTTGTSISLPVLLTGGAATLVIRSCQARSGDRGRTWSRAAGDGSKLRLYDRRVLSDTVWPEVRAARFWSRGTTFITQASSVLSPQRSGNFGRIFRFAGEPQPKKFLTDDA